MHKKHLSPALFPLSRKEPLIGCVAKLGFLIIMELQNPASENIGCTATERRGHPLSRYTVPNVALLHIVYVC